ncbi:unnamed protein product, partial [Nesidiocoris tenuis]
MLKPAESLLDKRLKITMCCRNGQILFFMSFKAGHLIEFSSDHKKMWQMYKGQEESAK